MNANLDLPIKAFFFYNKDDIPEVEGSSRYFDVKGTKRIEDILSFKPKIEVSSEKEKNVTYDIAPLYLKKGSYRMKIAVGPYIYWESFKVDYLGEYSEGFTENPLAESANYQIYLKDIAKQDYILTPGRYVGIEEQEDDGEPFEEKMTRLTSELSDLFAKSHDLEKEIREKLGAIGYEL